MFFSQILMIANEAFNSKRKMVVRIGFFCLLYLSFSTFFLLFQGPILGWLYATDMSCLGLNLPFKKGEYFK